MTITALPTTDLSTLDDLLRVRPSGDAADEAHPLPAAEPSSEGDAPVDAAAPVDAVTPAGADAPQQTADTGSADAAPAARTPRPASAGARRSGPPRSAPRADGASRGFPRAERPGTVPVPEHHHLPGWVRRDFGRVRPALADLLGLLQGDERARFSARLEEITTGINAGRFSLAFQYPALIEEGRTLYEGQREHIAEVQRAQREIERSRRLASDRLREAAGLVAPDVAGRLQRSLRSATSTEAITEVTAEIDRVVSAGQGTAGRRKQREIDRTRSRILRALPASALAAEEPQESWQDVLRRFAEGQAQEG